MSGLMREQHLSQTHLILVRDDISWVQIRAVESDHFTRDSNCDAGIPTPIQAPTSYVFFTDATPNIRIHILGNLLGKFSVIRFLVNIIAKLTNLSV